MFYFFLLFFFSFKDAKKCVDVAGQPWLFAPNVCVRELPNSYLIMLISYLIYLKFGGGLEGSPSLPDCRVQPLKTPPLRPNPKSI